MRNRQKTYLAVTAIAGIALAVTALATPSSGVLSGTVFARASFVDPVEVKFKIKTGKGKHERREIIRVERARETVVQQIVIVPAARRAGTAIRDP